MECACPSLSAGMEKPAHANLPSLTGIRFLAAFLVLFAHSVQVVVATRTTICFTTFAQACAYLGMTLFFVLSGFVIHYNYAERFLTRPLGTTLWSFAVARFARLYPMYLVCLLGGVIFSGLLSSLPDKSCAVPFHLSMTQCWLYLATPNGQTTGTLTCWLFPPAWSISTEVCFYFLFPLLLVPVSRLRQPRAILIAAGIFVIAAFVLLSLVSVQRQYLFDLLSLECWYNGSVDNFANWLAYFFPLVRFLEFCLGCLAGQLYLCLRQRPISAREAKAGFICLLAALSALILVIAIFTTSGFGLFGPTLLYRLFVFLEYNFLNAPGCAVLCFCAVRYKTVLNWFLNLPGIVLLGEASYSIYLLQHYSFGHFASAARPVTLIAFIDWTVRLTLLLGLVFLVSLSAYRYVEIPCRDWVRRILSLRSDRAASSRWLTVKVVATLLLIPTLFLGLGYTLYCRQQLPLLYCARASTRTTQGDLPGALADLDSALRRNPHHEQALRQKAALDSLLVSARAEEGTVSRQSQVPSPSLLALRHLTESLRDKACCFRSLPAGRNDQRGDHPGRFAGSAELD